MKINFMVSLILALIIVAACTPTGKVVREEKLKVGVLIPLSGGDAAFGNNMMEGLMLSDTSEDVELYFEDIGATKGETISAARKLIDLEGVNVLLTSFDTDTMTVYEVAEEQDVVVVCMGCGGQDLYTGRENLFGIWPSDEFEVKAVIAYFEKNEKAAILKTINAWEDALTVTFIDEWKGEYLLEETTRDDRDFKQQLLSIKEFEPDVIYLPFYEQQYPILLKQIRELDIESEIATTSWINDPTILANCGSYCDGLIVPQYEESGEVFQELHKARYGKEHGLGADVGFDAGLIMQLLSESNDLQKDLLALDIEGASGHIYFDETGKRQEKKVNLFKLDDQELVLLE